MNCCAVNPLLTGGFPYRRSIVRNCVVWSMHFALLVERWCLIKGFHIAGPVCCVCICSNPHHKRAEALMSSFMFVQTSYWTNSGYASESKIHDTKIMLLLCNLSFSNWWHHCPCGLLNHWSPVDSRCNGSLGLNFGGPVCGDSIAGGFLAQTLVLMFSFMFALTNNTVASELKSQDVYAMPLLCVICQSDIPHGWTSG